MTILFPFRFEPIGSTMLVSNEAGDFFFSTAEMVKRMTLGQLSSENTHFLLEHGFAFREAGDFHYTSFLRRLHTRKAVPKRLSYILAIPTLRCDLACSYCQVSRADENARGYDWTSETLARFLNFLDRLDSDEIKIEFQGGEPSLRADIMEAVIRHCEGRFRKAEFIICSNLSRVSPQLLALLERPNVFVSTSMDGPPDIHERNRLSDTTATARLFQNIDDLRERFGPNKVAALPTIAPKDYLRITEIIDAYAERGFDHVFLRPVSFHGFARKRHSEIRTAPNSWLSAYREGLNYIFDLNWSGRALIVETGLEILLNRIFRPSYVGHVDLRSPNPSAQDYIVVDHAGRLYPSDEARMLARIGQVELCIGSLEEGIDSAKVANLNWNQFNETDPDCLHCAFQPWCGVDLFDDLSRHGRVDLRRHETWFCRKNLQSFRDVFGMLLRGEARDLWNLNGHLTGQFDLTPFYGPRHYDPLGPQTA